MKSKIYFIDFQKKYRESILKDLKKLFYTAGFDRLISNEDLVALKLHVGEKGNLAYLRPPLVRTLVDEIKKCGGKPFLTDSNVLYKGSRQNAVDHLETALFNGFNYSSVNAPFMIADGLDGKDYQKITVNLKHFKEVNIGSAAVQADVIFALSHFKLHEVTGFGGALKNLGMGLGSRSGKQQMHAEVRPQVDPNRCGGDGKCIKWCPTEAISIINKKAVIDSSKCIGCAECIPSCRPGAIRIDWSGSSQSVQEKLVEYALGAVKDKKAAYLNFILDVSPECDCYEFNNLPIVPNIGILASTDPVAIDQASINLVNQQGNGSDKARNIYPDLDWEIQLKYAQRIGLGSREYELITR